MATNTTTLFNAYEAFRQIVETALDSLNSGWHVSDGEPRAGEYNNIAALLGATNWDMAPAGIGAGSPSFPLDEKYSIQVRLAVWDGGQIQSSPRNEIKNAYEAILLGVRNNPTLDVPGILWSHIGITEFEQGLTDQNGSAAQIDIFLEVTARIT